MSPIKRYLMREKYGFATIIHHILINFIIQVLTYKPMTQYQNNISRPPPEMKFYPLVRYLSLIHI